MLGLGWSSCPHSGGGSLTAAGLGLTKPPLSPRPLCDVYAGRFAALIALFGIAGLICHDNSKQRVLSQFFLPRLSSNASHSSAKHLIHWLVYETLEQMNSCDAA